MEENEQKSQEQELIEKGLKSLSKKVVKEAGKKIWSIAGKYILLFFGLLFVVSLILVLILFMPSLALRNASEKLTGESSVPDSSVTGAWGNPFGDSSYEDLGGRISSTMGPRTRPTAGASTWHKGVDVAIASGTPLYAAANGTVTAAGSRGKGGICVYIQTEDGYIFMCMHMSSVAVSVGQTVSVGDLIGYSGNSGVSTGAHLHFQIQAPSGIGTKAPDGTWLVDPLPYLQNRGTPGGGEETPGDGGENTGETGETLNISNFEQYWYNAENVKAKLDILYTTISDMNNAIVYITKDNFNMVLDKVIAYAKSVRHVTNTYTFYHHSYTKELSYAYRGKKDDEDSNSEKISSLGEGTDDNGEKQEETVEIINGEEIHYVWRIVDRERKDELGHIMNESPENDPIFKVSWQEIFTMAATKSIVQNAQEDNWVTDAKLQEVEKPDIDGVARLSEETVKQIIEAFQFDIFYYFDPTSHDAMPGSAETYAEHTYGFDEMESYAYIKSKEGENVEHGTEVFETPNFDYYEYKKPAIAPAYATNAYTTIEYDYTEQADGTALLAGRQVIVDGQKFYDHVKEILGEDFKMEWFVQFLSMLPGSKYDAGNGDLATRFNQILTSYQNGEPFVYYDSEFEGVGKVILGSGCSREPKYSTRTDEDGNPINPTPEYPINITVNDIDDEQIRQDIAAGKYTLEDLVYTAACAQAEAGSVEGQVAVSWLLRNRVRLGPYSTMREAVSAPGQFASPWAKYLNNASQQAINCAAAVLRGEVENPIGNAYFFFSASSVWGHKPGVWYRNVGGNMYYEKWGDVTQVVNRAGYVAF